ncbi:enteropeptidase-like isoform X4 [Rhopilema esculentum]|uniref:enteropeptidase-like isoform X4 n=1 Tax=Rhopilema esculentum TaxID=499914 RepID=UPI0031D344B4
MFAIYKEGSVSVNPERRPQTVESDNKSQKTSSNVLRNAILAFCLLSFIALLAVTVWALVAKDKDDEKDTPSASKITTGRAECKLDGSAVTCSCTQSGFQWNGTHCTGTNLEGGWCDWHEAEKCSASCGYGYQKLVRYCACPAPKFGGAPCVGSDRIYRPCHRRSCPKKPGAGCRETFVDDYGTVASPGYPNNNQRNIECTYTIIASRNEKVILKLNALDIESSKDCTKERLRIHMKGSLNVPPVVTLCDNQKKGSNYTSVENRLVVTFRNGFAKNPSGFLASYHITKKDDSMVNGGWCYWYPVTKCNATCSSGKQRFQRDCACPVPANGGKPCLGSAEQLIDCIDYDCITPTRGMSGTKTCDFEYTLGKERCHWSQDSSDDFDWTRHSGRPPTYSSGPSTDHTFRNRTGHYMYIYSNRRPFGSKASLLSNERESTAKSCLSLWYHMYGSQIGTLFIKKRMGASVSTLWSMSGNKQNAWWLASVPFSSSEPYKLVIEGTVGGYYGNIAIDDVTISEGNCPPPEPVPCNKTFNASSGSITSPYYPEYYPHNANCHYRVIVGNQSAVRLTFSMFNLQSSPSCERDSFKMYEDNTLKATLCGYSSRTLYSQGNEVLYVFKSDGSITAPGFNAYFREECRRMNLTGESGSFTSPGYPRNYGNSLNCRYMITVPAGRLIQITFPIFDTESCCDHVTIYNVVGRTNVFAIRLAGSGEKTFKSKTNKVLLQFYTDSSITRKGFVAHYTSAKAANSSTSCLNTSQCSYLLTGPVGSFSSPGYPNNYKNNECCHYNITAPADKRVKIDFLNVSMEGQIGGKCDYDSIKIYEGESGSEVLRSSLCGKISTTNFLSRSNKVYVYFRTDGTFTDRGFFAVYNTTIDAPPYSKVNEPNCGKSVVAQAHVIGGENASKGAWPWQIGLYRYGSFACGGSLIAPDWILTAAHCVKYYSAWSLTVIVGDLHRTINDTAEKRHRVSLVKIHPLYSSSTMNNDVALLKLQTPAVLNDHVNTVCLPNRTSVIAVGSSCYITGWGKIQHPGSSHPMLQQARLFIMDSQVCQRKLSGSSIYLRITNKMVCGGENGTNKSGCHGDSGGPLVHQDTNNRFIQHGVVSWGSPRCNSNESSSVFARVTEFVDWIKNTLKFN